MKTIACGVWAILILFLGVILWPTEVPNLKVLWGSTHTMVDGFGGGASEMMEPPLWFLVVGMFIIATVYTVPGLTFIFAKFQVNRIHEIWRLRQAAIKLIAESEATDELADDGRNAGDIGDYFSDPKTRAAAAISITKDALQSYEKAVRVRIESANARLSGPKAMSNKERHECDAVIRSGNGLLKTISTITI